MAALTFGNVLGGVNYSSPPGEMPTLKGVSYYLTDGQNIVPTLNGYGTKRGGSSKYNSSAYGSVVTTFHEFINSSGTAVHLCSQGTVIGKYSAGDFSNHITGLTSGLYGQWLDYGAYAIYANGTDKPQKTDGTTGNDLTSDESGLTAATCLAEWGERVWTAQGAKLIGSALRAPTDFSTATTDIGWWEGTVGSDTLDITALAPFFDMLLIGKLNQIYTLAGAPETASSTFRLQPLRTKEKDSIGFTAKNAITQVGNDLLFLDGFSIKRLSGVTQYGDVESSDILFNIKDYFKSSDGADLDTDYLQNAHFFHYKHKEQIWCSIPTGASTRFWMIIDYSNPDLRRAIGLPPYSFFPMSGLTPISFGGVTDGSKTDIYAGCQDGFVRKLDTGTNDTSTAVDAHAVWSVGFPERYVQPGNVNLNIWYDTACTITPSYALGLQDWADAIDSDNYTAMSAEDLTDSTWQTVGGVAQKRIDEFYANTGRSFALKLRHNTASQTFEMRASTLKYRARMNYFG